jgi:hypothetical protein
LFASGARGSISEHRGHAERQRAKHVSGLFIELSSVTNSHMTYNGGTVRSRRLESHSCPLNVAFSGC